MATTFKTPGVYVVERTAFPNSVVEVATSVPAFIGYTERADRNGQSLAGKAIRIASMAEFADYYGEAPVAGFSITESAPSADGEENAEAEAEADFTFEGKHYVLQQDAGKFLLYYSMLFFFANGGGVCYIVSVGSYEDGITAARLKEGIDILLREQEPTMLVIPEAVLLGEEDCIATQQAMLAHCGGDMRNRIAILDIHDGYKPRTDVSGDCIVRFRDAIGTNYLGYAAAYYPWMHTSVVPHNALVSLHFTNRELLQSLLQRELVLRTGGMDGQPADAGNAEYMAAVAGLVHGNADADSIASSGRLLAANSPLYNAILLAARRRLNLLPPSVAMAGVYTMVDLSRGVWKAPANVGLCGVLAPAVPITANDQDDLNHPLSGKSVNVIRIIQNQGPTVWGGRTLDGNSMDFRYINVRRTMIMLEESIRMAARTYVFEPNTANTWVTAKSMVSNFLTGIWKRGGLAGATADDAFAVCCGLGETMTPDDILEGIMRMTVLVALSRPAEFIEITFQQQMQKS
jgi:uncharacterized protein